MEACEAGFVQLELKYCERCGALWLRLRGSDVVICGACVRATTGLLPVLGGGGLTGETLFTDATTAPAFWIEGGNA